MGQSPSVLPYDTGKSVRRQRLVGLYILGSIEMLFALAIIGDGLIRGADVGTKYQTPTDRPVMIALVLAGGVLFAAALSALLWRVLRWTVLLVLQLVATVCQLPALREGRLDLAEVTRRGGDWGGLSILCAQCTILLVAGCVGIATLLVAYLLLPRARGAFA
jgi:hypothetical protein